MASASRESSLAGALQFGYSVVACADFLQSEEWEIDIFVHELDNVEITLYSFFALSRVLSGTLNAGCLARLINIVKITAPTSYDFGAFSRRSSKPPKS